MAASQPIGHHIGSQPTHRSPTYVSWMKMKSRCFNRNAKNFSRYGGSGITVCSEWMEFDGFVRDMGERPSLSHSIDRFPDRNGNYEPGNCRWATDVEQSRNRDCVRWLTVNGETMLPPDWAARTGISVKTIYNRLQHGWNDRDAIYGRGSRERLLTVDGITQTSKEWAVATGISPATICKRLKRGWSEAAALGRAAQ